MSERTQACTGQSCIGIGQPRRSRENARRRLKPVCLPRPGIPPPPPYPETAQARRWDDAVKDDLASGEPFVDRQAMQSPDVEHE